MAGTYKRPTLNTPMRTSFLYSSICSRARYGRGSTSTMTSVMRFSTPVTVNDRTWSPHLPPGMVGSQFMAKGRQMKQPVRMVAMDQAAMKPMAPRAVQVTKGTGKTFE